MDLNYQSSGYNPQMGVRKFKHKAGPKSKRSAQGGSRRSVDQDSPLAKWLQTFDKRKPFSKVIDSPLRETFDVESVKVRQLVGKVRFVTPDDHIDVIVSDENAAAARM